MTNSRPTGSRRTSGETLNFYSLPRQHHKHLKSTNMLERLNEEIKRRTRVVRIFPNPASCLRLVRARCAEVHEGWLEDPPLSEHGVLERAEEGTADRRLTDHGTGLSHEPLFAHLDVHNPGGPMRAYSMDLRERVLLDSDAGMKAADVAAKYRVSGRGCGY